MITPDGNDSERTPGSPDVERTAMIDATKSSAAFARHVEPEVEVLLRVAQSLTGSWSEAEGLVQETMIRAYKGIDSFDGAHPIDADPAAPLTADELHRLEAHLAVCDRCTAIVDESRGVKSALARLADRRTPDPARLVRLRVQAHRLSHGDVG